jgi:hypothetical protein
MPRIRRPSPATVIACLALGIALSGTAVAASVALAPNSVGTPQLKNNAVTTKKVLNGTLLRADFKANQIPAGKTGPAGPAGPAGAAGPAGPAGPSDAYSRFLNGPVAIPAASTTLANLTIPQAGKYVIVAKLYLTGAAAGVATCQLVAGTNLDQSMVFGGGTTPEDATLNVVNEFAAAGSVDLKCATPAAGLQANYMKITAIKVGNLTNSG